MNKSELAYKIYNNSGLGDEWPIDQEAFNHLVSDRSDISVRFYTHEEIGCAVVKYEDDRAAISLIAVEKAHQKKGVGKKLLGQIEIECRERGVDTIYVGHKMGGYLWPGAPFDQNSHIFFRSEGFEDRPDPLAWDLVLDLDDFVLDERLFQRIKESKYEMVFLRDEDSEELLKFEKENFSFWYDWYKTLVNNGNIERILAVKNSENEIVGATSLSWGDYKFQRLFDGVVGYGSMLGVRESDRKNGIGEALKAKGMELLRGYGVETVVVQYTTAPDFYKKLGFMEWRKYHMLQKRMG